MRLEIYVRPGSSRTSVGGTYDGALLVRVSAPPDQGRATAAALRAVAEALGLAPADVILVRGRTSRKKLVDVAAGPDVEARLVALKGKGTS